MARRLFVHEESKVALQAGIEIIRDQTRYRGTKRYVVQAANKRDVFDYLFFGGIVHECFGIRKLLHFSRITENNSEIMNLVRQKGRVVEGP